VCANFEPIKSTQSKWIEKHFNCDLPQAEWGANVYSTAPVPFIYLQDGTPKCDLAQFGLVPPWAKDKKKHGRFTYNARTESVATKPSYKSPWKERKFGLVLANKFYEPLYDDKGRNPVSASIFRTDGEPTAIASIWERFLDYETGEVNFSFSMLTINADNHALMSRFHKPADEKRSVVVVENGDFNKWLNATHEDALKLLKLSSHGYLDYNAPPKINLQQSLL
jgi:putative SOS response-associated peptidase YedK